MQNTEPLNAAPRLAPREQLCGEGVEVVVAMVAAAAASCVLLLTLTLLLYR